MQKAKPAQKASVRGQVHRYLSYREAWARIREAQDKSFYLEAVAIAESIMADRFASYLRLMDEKPPKAYMPFKTKVKKVIALQADPISMQGFEDLLGEVSRWADDRNAAVHGIVGKRTGARAPIEKFLTDAQEAAARGARLARAVSTWVASQERATKKRVADGTNTR